MLFFSSNYSQSLPLKMYVGKVNAQVSSPSEQRWAAYKRCAVPASTPPFGSICVVNLLPAENGNLWPSLHLATALWSWSSYPRSTAQRHPNVSAGSPNLSSWQATHIWGYLSPDNQGWQPFLPQGPWPRSGEVVEHQQTGCNKRKSRR